ncbi:MAG: type IV toxin-antitoxin system AbiEi family antitoxin domain-containing protein [Gammaproteobacteria bacterium]|nr:type IV toxin-antitoxin system AbiEi family antitoxin domain-containing protein [Gammaproteobacteria bacterium]
MKLSCPEKAYLEPLTNVPTSVSFDHANEIMDKKALAFSKDRTIQAYLYKKQSLPLYQSIQGLILHNDQTTPFLSNERHFFPALRIGQ